MKPMKFKSRKDGCSGRRGEAFASAIPNTYDIYHDGEHIGEASQISDPDYNGRTTAWIAVMFDGPTLKHQYLRGLKKLINDLSA